MALHPLYPHLLLFASVFLAACTPERTILYDDSPTGGLQELKNNGTVFVNGKRQGDRRAEFETLMNPNGIPQTKMDKVSAFQGKQFEFGGDTAGFGSKDASDAYRKKSFDQANKQFATRSWDGRKDSPIVSVETPDFVKLQRPVEKTEWKNNKDAFVMNPSEFSGRKYDTRGRVFEKRSDGLIEEKIKASPEPTITDWKEQQLRELQEARTGWKPLTPQ